VAPPRACRFGVLLVGDFAADGLAVAGEFDSPPKLAKTFMALDLAFSVATGQPFMR
jgi:hypothetical protein